MKRNKLGPSELILNNDGSIYHLHLLPEHVSDTIITVGDPERVREVSDHFDSVELRISHREFVTHTGFYKGRRLTVVSTGIGTDNIDIVFNELDALVNIDLKHREILDTHTSLVFIRIGTSGALQRDIPLGTFLLSESAFGYDDLLSFYGGPVSSQTECEKLRDYLEVLPMPYRAQADSNLSEVFGKELFHRGHTLTMPGFYAPQGRALRISNPTAEAFPRFADFRLDNGDRLTNLEMETSGIYGLSEVLGHHAVSISALLANRMTGEFHPEPAKVIRDLIANTLDVIVSSR